MMCLRLARVRHLSRFQRYQVIKKKMKKKVPSDKINLRHFPIWFLITFHSMHFYCQLLLCSVGFFHIGVFFSHVPLLNQFSWLHYLLIISFSCSLCFSYVCKIRACFHVASRRLHSFTQIRIYEKHLRHQHNSLAIFFRGFRVFFFFCKTFNRLCSLLT